MAHIRTTAKEALALAARLQLEAGEGSGFVNLTIGETKALTLSRVRQRRRQPVVCEADDFTAYVMLDGTLTLRWKSAEGETWRLDLGPEAGCAINKAFTEDAADPDGAQRRARLADLSDEDWKAISDKEGW